MKCIYRFAGTGYYTETSDSKVKFVADITLALEVHIFQ